MILAGVHKTKLLYMYNVCYNVRGDDTMTSLDAMTMNRVAIFQALIALGIVVLIYTQHAKNICSKLFLFNENLLEGGGGIQFFVSNFS